MDQVILLLPHNPHPNSHLFTNYFKSRISDFAYNYFKKRDCVVFDGHHRRIDDNLTDDDSVELSFYRDDFNFGIGEDR